MNFLEAIATLHGCVLFAQVFLYINRDNPVRHVFLALYAYLFYLYLQMDPVDMDKLYAEKIHEKDAMDKLYEKLMMCEHRFVSDMELCNHTHGQIM
jgi:hypothetical protein